MILEAMKMQNEIQAPLSGTVTAINCKPGDSVEANSPLIIIQPEENKTEKCLRDTHADLRLSTM